MIQVNGITWVEDNYYKIAESGIPVLPPIYDLAGKLNELPMGDGSFLFGDDEWNFITCDQLDRDSCHLKYDFQKISCEYKEYVKMIVLQKIAVDFSAFSTVYDLCRRLIKLTNYFKKNYLFDYNLLSLKIIQDYLNGLGKLRQKELYCYVEAARELLKCIQIANNNKINYNDIFEYLDNIVDFDLMTVESEEGKTSEIPKNFFDMIVTCAYKDLIDPNLDTSQKKEAGLVMLLSQIGPRLGEARLFEMDRLETTKIFDNAVVANYLKFKTYKTARNNTYDWTSAFLTENAVLAYKNLEEIAKRHNKKGCKYLFCNCSNDRKCKPLHQNTLRRWLLKFVVRHHAELDCINKSEKDFPGFQIISVQDTNKNESYVPNDYKIDLATTDKIFVPCSHQFRVTVANELDRQGVNLHWISVHMNHLTIVMTIHYNRRQKQRRMAETEYAKKILPQLQ